MRENSGSLIQTTAAAAALGQFKKEQSLGESLFASFRAFRSSRKVRREAALSSYCGFNWQVQPKSNPHWHF